MNHPPPTTDPGLEAPLVSVIIPTHNRAHLLPTALESCLAQTHRAIEIIVVDDGSTDDTPAVMERHAAPEIRYLRTENRGAQAARNTGIAASHGAYIKFLDSDDALMPDALEIQVARHAALGADPRAIVTGDFLRTDATMRKATLKRPRKPIRQAGEYDLGMVFINNPMTSCPLYPRQAVTGIGGFDTSVPIQQDFDFAVRIALAGYRYLYFPDVIYRWRVHRLSPRVSQTHPHTAAAHVELIERHARMMAEAYPEAPPPGAELALCKKAATTAFRVAYAGFMPEARQLAAFARKVKRPLGLYLEFEMALALSGLAGVLGRIERWLYRTR